MITGIVRFADTCSVSLVADGNLIFSQRLDYSPRLLNIILAKFSKFEIESLKFVIKTSVVSRPPSSATVVNRFAIGSVKKASVIAKSDVDRIRLLTNMLGLQNCGVYDYLDFYKSMRPGHSYIVVDENFEEQFTVAYISDGDVYDYRICRRDMLEEIINSIMLLYNCEEVYTLKDIKYLNIETAIKNYSLVDSNNTRIYLAPSLFTVNYEPSLILEGESPAEETYDEASATIENSSPLPNSYERTQQETEGVVSRFKNLLKPKNSIDPVGIIDESSEYGNDDFEGLEANYENEENVNNYAESEEYEEQEETTSASDEKIIEIIAIVLVAVFLGCLAAWWYLPNFAKQQLSVKKEIQAVNSYLLESSSEAKRLSVAQTDASFKLTKIYADLAQIQFQGQITNITFNKSIVETVVTVKSENDVAGFISNIPKSLKYQELKALGNVKIDGVDYIKYNVICKY